MQRASAERHGSSARRAWASRGIVFMMVCLVGLVLAPTPTAGAESIVQPAAADPSVIRADDGTYYMYATADD